MTPKTFSIVSLALLSGANIYAQGIARDWQGALKVGLPSAASYDKKT